MPKIYTQKLTCNLKGETKKLKLDQTFMYNKTIINR